MACPRDGLIYCNRVPGFDAATHPVPAIEMPLRFGELLPLAVSRTRLSR
jgi:hypothetical protein